MSLYPLSSKDIEAIGRSRANIKMPQTVKYWLYGGMGICIAALGYGALGGNNWVVICALAVGAIAAWYSSLLAGKVRSKVVKELKAEWREVKGK